MVKKDNTGSNWLKRQYLKTLIKGYAKKKSMFKKTDEKYKTNFI